MNNVIDALAQSPPSAEITEAAGKGYVLLPLRLDEVTELTNYLYEVLMARPDGPSRIPLWRPLLRAPSRTPARFITAIPAPSKPRRAGIFFGINQSRADNVLDLAYSMIAPVMPTWGSMNQEGWQKVVDFSTGAAIVRRRQGAVGKRRCVVDEQVCREVGSSLTRR